MSNYFRVIPRDLFNEAKLLKCLGKLYIEAENHNLPVKWGQQRISEGTAFDIHQDPSDGSISVDNIWAGVNGCQLQLWNPLNSREEYPLYCALDDKHMADEHVLVFDEDGSLSEEFVDLIRQIEPIE